MRASSGPRVSERSGTCLNARMAQVAQQRLTIRQIADLVGVSIATVSRVLNGRGDVSDETRDAVSRVIRENGYTANRSARGLSARRTGLVGILVPLVYPAYFSGILAGAAEALSERDLQIVLSPTGGEHDREVSVLDRLHGLSDGALIILPEESSEELERLLDGGYRFVVIDPLMPLDERIPSVSAAHTSGADQAMRHLLELGHRRIAQITGPRGWLATEDRRRGYQAALARAGTRPACSRRSVGRGVRRRRACNDRDAGADDCAPTARRDGTNGGQPAEPAAGAPALRDAARRAGDAPGRPRVDRTAAGPLTVVVHDLDVVAVGIEHEGSVVAGVVERALAGRPVVAVAGTRQLAVERVDGLVVGRLERDVDLLRRVAGDERDRA